MPVSGDFLIDTNALIKLLARDPSLRWHMGHDFRCSVSFITLGELCAGAHQSKRAAFNLAEARRIASEMPVLGFDFDTADEYGRIKAFLRKKGRPIPHNDLWIAATAVRNGLTLITLDKHFSWIDGLAIEIW